MFINPFLASLIFCYKDQPVYLSGEVTIVFCEDLTEHIITLCGWNAKRLVRYTWCVHTGLLLCSERLKVFVSRVYVWCCQVARTYRLALVLQHLAIVICQTILQHVCRSDEPSVGRRPFVSTDVIAEPCPIQTHTHTHISLNPNYVLCK
jgi:hypothetical protein